MDNHMEEAGVPLLDYGAIVGTRLPAYEPAERDGLIRRLRAVAETGCDPDLPHEAADEIERPAAERDSLLRRLHQQRPGA